MTRVLIVDDDPLLRRALACALARCGYDVSTATDGEKAQRIAAIATPNVAIVDLNMPGGGLELVRALKALADEMYVAVLSGEDVEEITGPCKEAGADEVLGKPISASELRRRVGVAVTRLGLATTCVAS